jgi:RNA polymerase sigma-70 factor (ECF subfamily)
MRQTIALIQDRIYEEHRLLAQIAAGDEEAFRQVYDHYRKPIYSYAFSLTESKDGASEILQEVFVKVWVNRQKLPEISNFNSWLFTVARNAFYDAIKKLASESKAKKVLKVVSDNESRDTDYFILNRDNEKLLQSIVEKLPEQQRLVFQLRSQGLKREEIAEKMNISENTVRVHLTRALSFIKTHLGNHTDTALLVIMILVSRN